MKLPSAKRVLIDKLADPDSIGLHSRQVCSVLRRAMVQVLVGALGFSTLVHAEVQDAWNASAELGYVQTSGNSDSQTLLSKFEGEYDYAKWEHFLALEALNTEQNDERSAEKYTAALQSDYGLSDRAYVFSALDWEKDRFSGYAYQASWVLGLGYKVINSEVHKLRFELAPGYRISEPDPGETQEDLIAKLSEKYAWKISESAQFEQSLSTETGDSNTRTRFKVSLLSQINSVFSMKLGYGVTHNSDVGPGVDKTDRETTITLVFGMESGK